MTCFCLQAKVILRCCLLRLTLGLRAEVFHQKFSSKSFIVKWFFIWTRFVEFIASWRWHNIKRLLCGFLSALLNFYKSSCWIIKELVLIGRRALLKFQIVTNHAARATHKINRIRKCSSISSICRDIIEEVPVINLVKPNRNWDKKNVLWLTTLFLSFQDKWCASRTNYFCT